MLKWAAIILGLFGLAVYAAMQLTALFVTHVLLFLIVRGQ